MIPYTSHTRYFWVASLMAQNATIGHCAQVLDTEGEDYRNVAREEAMTRCWQLFPHEAGWHHHSVALTCFPLGAEITTQPPILLK